MIVEGAEAGSMGSVSGVLSLFFAWPTFALSAEGAGRGAAALLKTAWHGLTAGRGSRGQPFCRSPPAVYRGGPRTCLDAGPAGHAPLAGRSARKHSQVGGNRLSNLISTHLSSFCPS